MKKIKFLFLSILTFMLIMTTSSFAFEDVVDDAANQVINELQEKGIVQGVDHKYFHPNRPLTYAEAVTLYVKAFDLNLNAFLFIKEPKASDSFTKVPDDAWYAYYFIVSYLNGIELPQDVDPLSTITREEFAFYLQQVLSSKYDYAVIELWNEYEDQEQVKEEYRGAINELITIGIIDLKENRFNPKESLTRLDAAVMLYHALQFTADLEKEQNPLIQEPVKVQIEPITDQINKVTINWGEKPNSGYRVSINKIEFEENKAYVYYTLHFPDPNQVYLTVITEAKTSTFIDSKYEIVAVPTSVAKPGFDNHGIIVPENPSESNES